MGFVDSTRHPKSTRLGSLKTGTYCSEGRSGITMKENGDVTLHVGLPKRRRISAVRDFPPGCGRIASSNITSQNLTGRNKDGHVEESEAGSATQSIRVSQSTTAPKIIEKQSFLPRRRVSAVRDFPPHCGRNAQSRSNEKHVEVLDPSKGGAMGQEANTVEKKVEEIVQVNVRGGAMGQEAVHTVEKKMEEIVQVNVRGGAMGQEAVHTVEKKMEEIVQVNVRETIGDIGGQDVDVSMAKDQSQDQDSNVLGLTSEIRVVLGLMAAPLCPWTQGKEASEANLSRGTTKRTKEKPHSLSLERAESDVKPRKVKAVKSKGRFYRYGPFSTENASRVIDNQLAVSDDENSIGHDEGYETYEVRARTIDVSLPPSCPVSSISRNGDSDVVVTRKMVRETLRLFQAVFRKLLQEAEAAGKTGEPGHRRIDFKAAKVLKDKGKYINTGKPIMGPVPGVEVGDEFQYRIELNVIGLHRQIQGGIDFVKQNGTALAVSVVASGGYENELESDVLIYTGSGGTDGNKQPVDQKLERGNLSLANSKHAGNHVRVIRGEDSDARVRTYVYDGLYLVVDYWEHTAPQGNKLFKFKLVRIPGQPSLAWKEAKQSKKLKVRKGVCVHDISHGKELIAICAVNTIDDELPPSFEYVTRMIYPDWCHPLPLKGCNCLNGCSEACKCSCVVKNGGEIPFNHNGAIVEAKPLVYECGPSCKCPSSCYNRVSQLGIKFQLEIFKTESRGWGVRSLDSIPSGSFVCEYVGELLQESEAEQRTGNDEYLFDIGYDYQDGHLWNEISTVMPDTQHTSHEVVESGGFTIDAASYGNVGRFINHSCSPNLYAQNVLYDYDDKRIPHIMLFAAETIPPLQELTYHYNYMIDQVYDSEGNIKKKNCYCGSSECTGRMY